MTAQVQLVTIKDGSYRNQPLNGTFQVLKAFLPDAINPAYGLITIYVGPNPFNASGKWKVKVAEANLTLFMADPDNLPEGVTLGTTTPLNTGGRTEFRQAPVMAQMPATIIQAAPAAAMRSAQRSVMNLEEDAFIESLETPDEAMDRIRSNFDILDLIVGEVATGDVRGLVVSGPPGIGKSHGAEKVLNDHNNTLLSRGAISSDMFKVIAGTMSPIGLYQALYHSREAGKVLVLDDTSKIFTEEEALDILKRALNTTGDRTISWKKESRILADMGIPDEFLFEAGIIFLTNINFDRQIAQGTKISEHLAAIQSRCHYMDLDINSTRDKILRIKQVIGDGMLDDYDFEQEAMDEIIAYIEENKDYLREISLRTVLKLANFKNSSEKWRVFADSTLLVKEAKRDKLIKRHHADQAAKAEAAKAEGEAAEAGAQDGAQEQEPEVVIDVTPGSIQEAQTQEQTQEQAPAETADSEAQ